ncbi:MAG: chitobiase/beta-hexosaminidase C-terminal domain-containing protein [Oscillospiraceae bacterium]|nr:chitobiase/beta-hexosaminidase C-terminal domain-containing protein [Oscillospiraceae bacterium]
MKKGKRIIAALLSALLITGTGPAPVIYDTGFSLTAYAAETVKTPAASLKSGTYTAETGKNITLSCGTEGADIYYSLNGSDYKKYTSKLSLTKNSELEIYASYKGRKSKTVSYSYKLKPEIAVSKKAGKYNSAITVKLSSAAKNVKFYYTLDGSAPTAKSAKYTSKGISLTKSCKLRVAAVKSGWTTNYYTGDYTIGTSAVTSDGILNDYKGKYFYSQMNSSEKKLYAAMFKGIANHEEDISFKDNKVTTETLNYVFELLRFENPQFFWLLDSYQYYYENDTGLAYSICPEYEYTKTQSKKMQASIDKKVTALRKKLRSCKTEYEKVLKIHDEIVNTTVYVYTGDFKQHNIYGTLVEKKAVCQGYANAFSYFCQLEGIQCVNVNGTAVGNDTEWHEWNRVKVDGKWYNMDVTWDDPVGTPQILLHDYFLITDKQLDKDHVSLDWFPFGKNQKATSTSLNYFKKEGLTYYTDAKSAYNGILKQSSSNYKNGVYTTVVYCHFNEIYELFCMFEKSKVYDDFEKYGVYPSGMSFSYDANKFVLTLNK